MVTATAKVVPIKKEPTLGQLIDQLAAIEEARSAHAAAGKKLDLEKTALTALIFAALDAQNTLTASSKTRRISISEQQEPRTIDWDEGLAWLKKNDCLHLVQRRIGAPAWRELRALPKYQKKLLKIERVIDGQTVVDYEVPGFETVLVRKLSFTKV